MRRLLPVIFALAVPVLAGRAPVARADLLVPRGGKPVRGALVSEQGGTVVFNPYWSTNPEMTWEVVRLPKDKVKRIDIRPHPEVEVFRRLAAAKEGDADALLTIAAYAKENKLKAHERMCLALVLAKDPDHAEALKRIRGRAKFEAAKKGNIHLDAELEAMLAEYVATDDATARGAKFAAIKKKGLACRPEDLERHRRSRSQPKGLQVDRPLAWRSDEMPGAVYTLFVPQAYDPVVPWPLIIGLHGGGPDGKSHDEVVGSGRSAMNFYRDLAARHGYLVACPDALSAGWGSKDNEALVRAVIDELKLLYNIDIDRIYMTGHSMGGYGTWSLGPRFAAELAAISPMAGAGRGGISQLVKTKTPIFIYHSDNDFVSVSSDRQAAKQLRDSDLDFVYTELPGKGHGFPESIRHELFAFFGPRRLHDPKHKDVWPRSSLFGKVTKQEKRYLGNPLAELEGEVETLDEWIEELETGGGRAAYAAERIGTEKPEGAAAAVAKILKDDDAPFDARAFAARALGRLGDPAGLKALRKAVALEAVRDQSRIAVEAARALAVLKDAEAKKAFAHAVRTWTDYLESKVMGDKLRFSDWERAVPVLAVLVDAWLESGAKVDVSVLDDTVVKRVLAPDHAIDTSERVPQDPEQPRAALAKATAAAYKAAGADEGAWKRLLDAVSAHEKTKAAVESAR